jgi:hypothetical protein
MRRAIPATSIFFHGREERVASAAASDAETLEAAGCRVRGTRRLPTIYTAEVSAQSGATHLEWVVEQRISVFSGHTE